MSFIEESRAKRTEARLSMESMLLDSEREERRQADEVESESGLGEKRERPTYAGDSSCSLLDEYEMAMKCYLGHSSTIRTYRECLSDRVNDPGYCMLKNFYAIVMPGGHGKTYLAKTYGFLDVDNMIGPAAGAYLYTMRNKMVERNTLEWADHNSLWYTAINNTLSMMPMERPTLILVHSEECAIEIGAQVIGALVLNSEPFEANIQRRYREGKKFSRISRQFVLARSLTSVEMMASNGELEARVLELCNVNSIPVACPYKYSYATRNIYYGKDVPSWLLEGKVAEKRQYTDAVVNFERKGSIPKECVDHFMKANAPGKTAHGFGVTMNDWAIVLAKIADKWGYRTDFDLEGDMFEIFPPRGQAERNRINITVKRLVDRERVWDDPDVLYMAQHHVGEAHVFIASIIAHWLGIGKHLSMSNYIFNFYLVPEYAWGECLKEVHNLIRLSDWYCTMPIEENERQSMMYMEMLIGRKMYDADWKKVLSERESSAGTDYVSFDPYRRKWSRAQYLEDFSVGLSEAYSRMFEKPTRVDVKNFPEFWKNRRSWVAKGSTVLNQIPKEFLSYHVEFITKLDASVERIKMRHNKKSLFESEDILGLIHETLESWNATKVVPKLNETGKERELLPGTLLHYLIFSYVLWFAEKQVQIGSTRLNLNEDDDIRLFDRKMEPGLQHALYDWANFNAQHSIEDMGKVISWLKYLPGVPDDYKYYCDAIAESFSHMYLIDDEGGRHKLEKGLFSGWRGTTWINTVLNYVYVSIGIKSCKRVYRDFNVEYVDHGGDDVDMGFRDTEDCFRMIEVMDAIGFEAKAIKQMVANKAEFFRNTITTKGVFASPTRALANFISGNWETGGAKTLLEKTTSVLDQVSKLIRRGVEPRFGRALGTMALGHWLKIKMDDEWVKIKPEVIHGRVEDGGLGVPDDEGNVWVLDRVLQITSEAGFNFRLPGEYCSSDFVEEMEKQFERSALKIYDRKGLVSKLARQSYDLQQFQDRAEFAELNKVKAKAVEKVPVVEKKWDEARYASFLRWANSGGEELAIKKLEAWTEFIGHIEFDGMLLDKRQLMQVIYGRHFSMEAVDFKGDVYYRRLVPDFLGNMIDAYVRTEGNLMSSRDEEMQEWFRTLCYMASMVYEHRA